MIPNQVLSLGFCDYLAQVNFYPVLMVIVCIAILGATCIYLGCSFPTSSYNTAFIFFL